MQLIICINIFKAWYMVYTGLRIVSDLLTNNIFSWHFIGFNYNIFEEGRAQVEDFQGVLRRDLWSHDSLVVFTSKAAAPAPASI